MTLPSAEIIEFIEGLLVTPEGAKVGKPIVLRPWQREVIEAIYDEPTRRAIISFPRKQGKTAISAMLLLAHLVGPQARRNAQITPLWSKLTCRQLTAKALA